MVVVRLVKWKGMITGGSKLKLYVVTKDGRPANFERRVNLVRTFQSALPRSKKDPSKLAREYEPARAAVESDGEAPTPSWSDVEAEDAEAEDEGEYGGDGQGD